MKLIGRVVISVSEALLLVALAFTLVVLPLDTRDVPHKQMVIIAQR